MADLDGSPKGPTPDKRPQLGALKQSDNPCVTDARYNEESVIQHDSKTCLLPATLHPLN